MAASTTAAITAGTGSITASTMGRSTRDIIDLAEKAWSFPANGVRAGGPA